MAPTRYLRERLTQPIDDTTLAAIVAQVLGPPGLVRYAPRSPALFPVRTLAPPVRTLAPPLVAGGLLALLTGGVLLGTGMPAQATVPLPPRLAAPTATPTVLPTDTATILPTAPLPATATRLVLPPAPVRTVWPLVPLPPTGVPTLRPAPPPLRPVLPTRVPTLRPLPTSVPLPPTSVPLPPTVPVVIPPVTPGTGAAGNDFCRVCFERSATIKAAPTP